MDRPHKGAAALAACLALAYFLIELSDFQPAWWMFAIGWVVAAGLLIFWLLDAVPRGWRWLRGDRGRPTYERRETIRESPNARVVQWEEVRRGQDATTTPGPITAKVSMPQATVKVTPAPAPASPPSPSFTMSPSLPEFTAHDVVRDRRSFRSRTIIRVGVTNHDLDAQFTAQAKLLAGQAIRSMPREALGPPEYHDVAWEHTTEDRALVGKATTKRLVVMWTFVDPHTFWFRVAKNSTWNPDGYGSGWVLEPLARSLDFELCVTNQRTGESISGVYRVTFTEDSHLVESFDRVEPEAPAGDRSSPSGPHRGVFIAAKKMVNEGTVRGSPVEIVSDDLSNSGTISAGAAPPRASHAKAPRSLCAALHDEVTEGEGIKRRILAMGKITAFPWEPPATEADVDEWDRRVARLLEAEPRERAHFVQSRSATASMSTLTAMAMMGNPLGARMERQLSELDKIIKELCPG